MSRSARELISARETGRHSFGIIIPSLSTKQPRFVRLRSAGARSGPPLANARLTREEVVHLADAAARARGYAFTEYAHPEAQYDPADQIWLLAYDQKLIGKHFIVAVGDRSKRTTILESTK